MRRGLYTGTEWNAPHTARPEKATGKLYGEMALVDGKWVFRELFIKPPASKNPSEIITVIDGQPSTYP